MTVCSVEHCDKESRARGWCLKHYHRWRKYGDPLTVLQDQAEDGAPQEFIEIALKHQDKEACLYWPYARESHGYAFHNNNTVHRRICEIVHGPPPRPEHQACHNCGNGNLGCVNPHHLRWDTRTGNEGDKVIHGTTSRGEQSGHAKLTWEKVREIRAMREKLSQREIGSIYGVNQVTVSLILRGKTWKDD